MRSDIWSNSVHPRACGEQRHTKPTPIVLNGSSPRLRGTVLVGHVEMEIQRFIPAPAGNSSFLLPQVRDQSVHPRACGEQISKPCLSSSLNGSSPRLRGTDPKIRGGSVHRRFIPAPAGNSEPVRPSVTVRSVHPRACGEQFYAFKGWVTEAGSSPRLRGTASAAIDDDRSARFIPAPAGNSPARRRSLRVPSVHPRACGEQSSRRDARFCFDGSSPRLRGTG